MLRILLPLLALVTAVQALEEEYSIRRLKTGGNIEPQPATAFMEPMAGQTHLMPEAAPEGAPPGFLLRRRFWNGKDFDYILFRGSVQKQSCYRGLSFFRAEHADSLPVRHLKYFATRDFNFYGDVEDVYFLGPFVLAPHLELHYKWKGRALPARRVDPPVGCLEIRSDPSGARVRIDGKEVGLTPLFLPDLRSRLANITLASTGHLPWAQDVTVHPESTVAVRAELFLQTGFATAGPDLAALLRPDADSPEEYASREERLRRQSATLARRRDSLAARVDSAFPAFLPSGKETAEQARIRWRKHQFAKSEQRLALLRPLEYHLREYGLARDSLRRMRERLECVPVALELSGSHLELGEYDGKRRELPVRLEAHMRNHQFTFDGRLRVSPREDRDLRARKQDASLRMHYLRIPLSDSAGREYYFTLWGLQVRLDSLLPIDSLRSAFRYPANLWKAPDSLAVEQRVRACRYLHGRLAGMGGRMEGPGAARWRQETRPALPGLEPSRARWKAAYWAGSALGAGLAATFGYLAGTSWADSKRHYDRYREARSESAALTLERRTEDSRRQALIFGGITLASLLAAGTTAVFAF